MIASRLADTQRRLDDLDFASQFIVWGARQWIGARVRGDAAARRLVAAFGAARVPGALEWLDAVLATLACHAPRRLDFRPAGDLHLGRDEDALLELLRSMQRHAPDASQELRVRSRDARAAALVALRWVGSATACLLAARLLRLADELAAGGLWIGSGEAAAWRAARAAPGAALRH